MLLIAIGDITKISQPCICIKRDYGGLFGFLIQLPMLLAKYKSNSGSTSWNARDDLLREK